MPANDPSQQSYDPQQDHDRTVAYRPPQYGGPRYNGPSGQPPYGAPQGQPPYGQAHQDTAYSPQPSWARDTHVLGGAPGQPAPRRRSGWILALVAAVIVALLGGGGYFAVNLLSGGGTQPQDVLPGNALAYVRLDLDPAANQKIALYDIARKFTTTKDAFSGDDPRQAIVELLRQGNGDTKIDFAKDVEPWLGHRVGAAVLPPERGKNDPRIVLAVQVTDEQAARAGIDKLDGDSKNAIAFRDGYALIGSTKAIVDEAANATTTLAQNSDFTGDMAALGEPGVLSFWMDLDDIAKASGALDEQQQASLKQIEGARVVAALRFDSEYAELAGLVRGAKSPATGEPAGAQLTGLPASTAGALSISGLGEAIEKQWDEIVRMAPSDASGQSLEQQLASFQQSTGLRLPQDLVTLLGKNVTIAVDEQGLDGETLNVGARLATDPAAAEQVVARLEQALNSQNATAGAAAMPTPQQLFKASRDGAYVVAGSREYADRLAQDGTLGENETFRTAVPNADSATFALFVDLDKIEKYYLQSLQGDDRANAQVLRAVGVSGTASADEATFSVRVLFN